MSLRGMDSIGSYERCSRGDDAEVDNGPDPRELPCYGAITSSANATTCAA